VEHRIESMGSFKIVGRLLETSMDNGKVFQDAPEFWSLCDRDGTTEWLRRNAGPLGVFGASLDIDLQGGIFRYYAAVERPADLREIPTGFTACPIPACTWAVFGRRGPLPLTYQALVRDVYSSWIPASPDWCPAGFFQLERFPDLPLDKPREHDRENRSCELWIPVRPKGMP
jgi:AraC family transcriptional regulator